MKFQTI